MAGEPTKDQPQKAPEKQEGEKTPEAQKPQLPPEKQAAAATRMEWKDFMSKEGLDRMQKIKERKDQIDAEQKKLQEDARAKRNKENWVNNPPSSPVFNPRGKISEKVEAKSDRIKSKLETGGINNETNLTTVKQVLKEIVYDQYTKTGKDEDITSAFADGLDDKISYLFDELKKLFDAKKHPFAKPNEMVENFSDFTGTNFLKKEYLQANELKEFFLLERSNYESFIDGYGKYLGLGAEKKQLEGEEATLMSKGLEPKELIDQKRITFTKTRFTAPKDAKDLDKVLQEEIPKALPPIADDKTKQKIVDYLAAEVKKLNPQPEEVFELSPDGKWTKIDIAAENKSKDDAKTDAEKQTEETTAAATTENKPFNLTESFKSIGDAIVQFFRWILNFLGIKSFGNGPEDLVREWKDVTQEEREQVKQFFTEGKKYFSKMENMSKFFRNADEARRVLTLKKNDTLKDETWGQWIERHVSKDEQEQISISTTLEAKNVADMFISENTVNDKPAQPLETPQGNQPQQNPDAASGVPFEAGNERARLIMDRIEASPYTADLKAIIEGYIESKGRPEIKEGLAKVKSEGKKLSMREYMEFLSENFLRDQKEFADRYQKRQISLLEISEGIFDDLFRFALAEAKTPQEKQKVEEVLAKFKGTLDEVMKEKGPPGQKPSAPQNAGGAKTVTS